MDHYDNTDHPCYTISVPGDRRKYLATGGIYGVFLSMLRKSLSQNVIFLDISLRPNYLEKKLRYKKYFSYSHPNLEKHP